MLDHVGHSPDAAVSHTARVGGRSQPHTRLRDTITLFQRHLLRAGKSEHTVKSFTSDLQLLMEHSGDDTGARRVHHLRLERVSRLDGAWARRAVQPQDLRPPRDDAQGLLQVAARIGAIPHDPARAVLQRSAPRRWRSSSRRIEVTSVIAFARGLRRGDKPDARPEMLFRLLLDTGIKKSETMRLTPADVVLATIRRR